MTREDFLNVIVITDLKSEEKEEDKQCLEQEK